MLRRGRTRAGRAGLLIPDLGMLRRTGEISVLDMHFAQAMARLGGETRPEVELAAGLVSRNVRVGHVCLDVPRFEAGSASLSEMVEPGREWPGQQAWLEALASSALVEVVSEESPPQGAPGCPFVLDGAGRLYLRRCWDDQQALARALRARIEDEAFGASIDEAVLAQGLDRLFPGQGPGEAEPDLQREAAAGAVRSRFFVISGGPGTGKTFTVVNILALFVEQALARKQSLPRMQLVAPTGKAAANLQAAVRNNLASLDCSEDVRAAVPLDASTIHRALGALGGPGMRFRHSRENPLEVDVLLVDEASMVDLALMTRLVEALPTSARLILLGDRDQLASVEAGAVLGDIGRGPGGEPVSAPSTVVHLTRNYRFAAGGAVEALTRCINAGDGEAALALLDDPARGELRLLEPSETSGWGDALAQEIRGGYAPFVAATRPEDRLESLEAFRVLCAHRHGPGGVDALNAETERLLGYETGLDLAAVRGEGRPIGINRNDYELDLYNGDVGITALDPDAPERGLRVYFRGPDGTPRWLSPLSVGPAETVFAMTVHKSQGSEYASVALVLPDEVSPILSRELVYTAVSRARERVTIFASRAVFLEAIGRRIERSSGLSQALWG